MPNDEGHHDGKLTEKICCIQRADTKLDMCLSQRLRYGHLGDVAGWANIWLRSPMCSTNEQMRRPVSARASSLNGGFTFVQSRLIS